jgi:hypothetical protein
MSTARAQVPLFGEPDTTSVTRPDLQSYDHILVAFSGFMHSEVGRLKSAPHPFRA